MGSSINDVGNWVRPGGGVKNWSKLPMDSTKKLPIMGVSKMQKNCRRLLWMAGHDRIKKPAAAAMKYVAISYCSIYDEKKEGKEIISLSKNNNLTSLINGF